MIPTIRHQSYSTDGKDYKDIFLRYINELCFDAEGKGFEEGREMERKKLAAHVEGMARKPVKHWDNSYDVENANGYNQALDDLLAHLRQSTTNPEPISNSVVVPSDAPQGCCDECKNPAPFGITRFGYRNCFNPNCPNCHKKAPQGDNKQ